MKYLAAFFSLCMLVSWFGTFFQMDGEAMARWWNRFLISAALAFLCITAAVWFPEFPMNIL